MTLVIKFDDIQKGDTVRTTRVFENGFTLTLQGKAEKLHGPIGGRGWYTDSHCVASENFGMKAKDYIELIERPQKREWVVAGFKEDGSIDPSVASLEIMTEDEAKALAASFCETYKHATRYSRNYKALKVAIPA